MPELPPLPDSTIKRIYEHYESEAEDWRRPHLGASVIGHACTRFLWYSFRWAVKHKEEGRVLRFFETGQIEEQRVILNLRATGVDVSESDPATEEQWRFSAYGGHFGGSCDGIAIGFVEAPKSWHVLEVKTANTRWFKKIRKGGVKEAHPQHYAQVQVYMKHFRKLHKTLARAFQFVVHKDTDDIYTERIRYSREEADAYMRKAELVIRAHEPLTKIHESPAWHACTYCKFRPVCHLEQPEHLERNCRTCASSTPMPNGEWFCDHHQKVLATDDQRAGCDRHLFIPKLLPWEPTDANEKAREIHYRDRNGAEIVDANCALTVKGD